ncbi:MAG: RNA-binding protein [Firmicutes bacterium]|jgi:ribosomal protein L14E/L6E/L27E|nr:RNA-binding protein [Bacillota bacterium]
MELLNLGQLVTSRAGRDAGRKYVVIGFSEPGFVLVADGEIRKVSRPKRKNVKHLIAHRASLSEDSLSNGKIRRFIESHSAAEKQGEEGSTVYGER